MRRLYNSVFILFFFVVYNAFSYAQSSSIEVGIDEQLGKQFPLDTQFIDEDGNPITLKDIVSKPTILMFVYYGCPGICNPLMSEVASLVSKVDLIPGKDYQIVSISFDEFENNELAKRKKETFLNAIKKKVDPSAWRFLTGDSININKATSAVGFKFKREGKDFIHAGALMFLSPDGKITRYLPGTKFLPFDIKMALIEAAEGKVTPTIAKLMKFCFSYDAAGKKYTLNVTRIAASIIIVAAIIFVIVISIKPRSKEKINKGI